MGKAEVGTPKWVDNRNKSKGLTKLNFYCPVCQKANRDENAFKQHTMSESHVRKVELMGDNANGWIEESSNEFKGDFLRLLRTSHGDKQVNINHFYQVFIADKHHVHMVGTKWSTLTEFAKYLGREGICRVEETDKGTMVAWIDNSPEALRRRETLRLREQQEHGEGEIERRLIRDQIRRARAAVQARSADQDNRVDGEARELTRQEGDKISLNFAPNAPLPQLPPRDLDILPTLVSPASVNAENDDAMVSAHHEPQSHRPSSGDQVEKQDTSKGALLRSITVKKFGKPQAKNVFAQDDEDEEEDVTEHKSGGRKLMEADRIMREEQQRKSKRGRDSMAFGFGMPLGKRPRPGVS